MSTNSSVNSSIHNGINNERNFTHTPRSNSNLNRSENLKCGSLNVCGLKRRLEYPEFCELIKGFDFFCVSESKIDKYDIISLDGYNYISQCRKQPYIRKSGGIGVFVKSEIYPYVTVIESDSDYILWFRLDKSFCNSNEDLVFGAIYLPPADSRFHTQDEMDNFELEISSMSVLHKYLFLFGDFNAKTERKEEFLDVDNFFERFFEFDDTLTQFYNVSDMLIQYKMDKTRSSKDKNLNNEGRVLLEICKSNNLFILNGRCGRDKGNGEYTFKQCSIIDYSIVSAQALKFVSNFEICELDPLFTDGHSLLITTLRFPDVQPKINQQKHKNVKKRPKWQDDKRNDFTLNIDVSKIGHLRTQLQQMQHRATSINKDNLNEICSSIANVFSDSANQSFRSNFAPTEPEGHKPHKRWFGAQCQSARRKYHLARRINHDNPSPTNRLNLKNESLGYKRVMNFHLNKFNRETQEKLRRLKSTSPKEFWKIINNLEKNGDDQNINIETLHNFFKELNTANDTPDEPFINIDISDDDEFLNSSITESEIRKCLNSLKNNKASANDNIINEYMKYSAEKMMPIYILLFNLVLDTGILPDAWLEGIIRPIYKRSGDPKKPENYRPITILSCFGKLFTSVLNLRLNNFIEHHNILNENQAGFRSGYSTTDHIFTLHALTEILKQSKKKLYCCFVDFSKAFDSVWRVGLWMKLLSNNINGKIFRVIHNMYRNIKSCVMYAGDQSSFFPSFKGVRQGENLSPILFSLFLNDLEDYMRDHHCYDIELGLPGNIQDTYIKLMLLLYADDAVIFGTDAETLQNNINVFYEYSQQWQLNVNFNKTKVMVFGLRNTDNLEFKIGNNTLEICDEFKYLGTVFTKQRSFFKAIRHNVDHAKKALHLLYKRINNLNIPIDLQIQLFDHTVLPILLYGSEVWGFTNTNMIDVLHNQFLRSITKLRKSTPTYMLYAELGRVPIHLHIKKRIINYWISLINGSSSKFARKMYDIMLAEHENGKTHKWISYLKSILISVGLPDLIYQPIIINPQATKAKISETLKDLYIQEWHAKLDSSSKGRDYGIYKSDISIEPYFMTLNKNAYYHMVKFRTANFKLPIETGRWENVPVNERKCMMCDTNDIGDSFHYLFKCPFFVLERSELLKPYFYTRPNIIKYKELLTCKNKNVLQKLSKFMKDIMHTFH